MFVNGNQDNEQQHKMMAQEGRKKTTNDMLDVWNTVFENASQHNEQQHEKMAQEGRKKTVNDVLEVWNPVFENASQHNEQRREKMAQEGRRKTIIAFSPSTTPGSFITLEGSPNVSITSQ